METFTQLNLNQSLMQSINRMQFKIPTPIQAQAIPPALLGKDILGTAQTGTGKTLCYGIACLNKLLTDRGSNALIVCPTRELAVQVGDVLSGLIEHQMNIKSATLIGGESMQKQLRQLRKRPRLIIGTPGRLNDHLQRKSLRLNETYFLVLDETDRMLDMGFGVQIDRILKHVPKVRQTLMYSATLPEQIVKLSRKYLISPERISVGKSNVIAANIENEVIKIKNKEKYQLLLEQLEKREGTVLIFVKTKHGTVKMAKNLSHDHFMSEPLNGNLRQNKRDKVMKKFREKKFRIMVATDIAARGLDVPHIEHVINYDLPQLAEDYIHRLGRTGRAKANGSAVTFVSSKELGKWNEIERMLDPSIKRLSVRNNSTSSKNKKKSSQNKSKSKLFNSKSKRPTPEVSSRSSRFSNQKSNKDFRLNRSSNYKKKKRVDEDIIEKDNETSTSFFKKKGLKNKIFNSRNNKKNRSFKLNDSRSGSPSKSKFKKRKSVNSLSKKKPNKNFSKKK